MSATIRGFRAFPGKNSRRRLLGEMLERRDLLAANPTPAAAPGDLLLPDMFPWASEARSFLHGSYIDIVEQPGHKLLRFSTAVANIGVGAMELRGGAILPSGNQEVYQRVFKEGGGFNDSLVGEFTYHPEHQHIHFDDYAVYNLRQALIDDGVGNVVATGGKVSFCLLDVTRYQTSAPASVYRNCEQTQGISVGWADVYDADLPDQWIDVTDIPDGEYWLEVVVDPENRLLEADETNNIARVRVTLGAGGLLADRFEANNDIATATNFGTNVNRTENDLSIHEPGDVDFFRFVADAAGMLDISIAFSHALGDLDLELLNESGEPVAQSGSTDDYEQLTYQVAAGETYFLRVFEFNSSINPNYDLSVELSSGVAGDRFEDDDSFATATNLGNLGNRVEADLSIHESGDDDYFVFRAAATGTLDVSLNIVNVLGDLDFELYNAQFGSIGAANSQNDVEQLSVLVVSGRTYYLRVFGKEGATNDAYTVTFDGPGGAAGDRFEDNNSPTIATNLGLLGDRTENNLSVHLPNDDDYYRFTAAGTGTLTADLTFLHAEGDLDFELLDASLAPIAQSSSFDDNEELVFQINVGETYYLRVYGFDGATNASYNLSIDGPAPGGNIAGTVWDDRDHNGVRDASEPGLPGRLVYVDSNHNGAFDSFPSDSELFEATGLPRPINDHVPVESAIDVSGIELPIASVSVQLSLTHSYVGDLHVHLRSPSGAHIELFSHVGGSGDDMTSVTFADTAPISIDLGSSPFSGQFRPLEPLSTFAGEMANGEWTLEVSDDEDGDIGSLHAWSLNIVSEGYFEPSASTDSEGAYVITGLPAGEHTVAEVLPPEWIITYPTENGMHAATVVVGQTTTEVNFGNYLTTSTLARVVEVRLQRSANPAMSYSLPVGSEQLDPIPLVGIDQIAVVFERAWEVGPEALILSGVATPNYDLVDEMFSTAPGNAGTFVATWTLPSPLNADRLLATVRANATGEIRLDGEWSNRTSGGQGGDTFPSGDGQPGGDFAFRFDVLPGDTTADGFVDAADIATLVSQGFVDYSHEGYEVRYDLDGNGRVSFRDAVLARNYFGVFLPSGEPASPPAESPAAAALVARAAHNGHSLRAERRVVRAISRGDAVLDSRLVDAVISQPEAGAAPSLRVARVRTALR
jgi:subtilisin-like proprotein convertase family protein